jgi:hypothetical protein
MENILNSITTPLSLAALAILAFTGFYQATKLRRGKPLDNRSFWIILIFGISANAIYAAKDLIFTDIVIRGNLRHSSGKPLPNATIDIAGVGQTATSDAGLFEISVPYSRQSASYQAYVFSNGIPGEPITISGPRPEFLNISFEPNVNLDAYIDIHDTIYISQNIGKPMVTAGFRTNQKIDGRVKMSLFEAKISRFDKQSLSLFPITYARNGSFVQIGDIILDTDNQSAEYSIMSAASPGSETYLFQDIIANDGLNWMPDCQNFGISTVFEQKFRQFFSANFFWLAGDYTLTLRFRVEGKNFDKSYEFSVSKTDQEQLQNIQDYLTRCKGVASDLNQLFLLGFSDGKASNTLLKKLY